MRDKSCLSTLQYIILAAPYIVQLDEETAVAGHAANKQDIDTGTQENWFENEPCKVVLERTWQGRFESCFTAHLQLSSLLLLKM